MKKFFKSFSLIGLIMLVMCAILGVGDVYGAICANGAAAATDLTPAGEGGKEFNPGERGAHETLDTRALAPDLALDPIDQALVKIRPYINPLDTILRYCEKKPTNNLEFAWYSIGSMELADEVGTGGAVISGGETDPKQVYGYLPVKTNFGYFNQTDTIKVEGVAGRDGKALMLYVYKKDSANHRLYFTVSEDQMTYNSSNEQYTIPAIPANTKIFRLGRAAQEKDVFSPSMAFAPKKTTGYCQIFMAQIAMSTFEMMMDKEVKFDLSETEEQALFEYRRAMEGSLKFGVGGNKIYDPDKESYIYSTEGIFNQVLAKGNTHTLNAYAEDGNKELVKLAKKVFTKNNGSKKRFALLGSDAMEAVSTLNGLTRMQNADTTLVEYGITWNRLVTNYGEIEFIYDEQMDEYGYSDKMFIFDPQFLKKWGCQEFKKRDLDGNQAGILNGKIITFSETCGVAVYNPKAHCIVTVVTSAPTPTPVAVTSVALGKSSTSIVAGEDETVTVTINPSTATNKVYTAVSSDTTKATVAVVEGGIKVTAVAAGSANIIVASAADSSKTDTLAVTVTAAE